MSDSTDHPYSQRSMLSEEQRRALLRLARQAVERSVIGAELESEELLSDALQQKAAVFVTLWKIDDQDKPSAQSLRGCIGQLKPELPLYKSVQAAATGAAVRDPRFAPVQTGELDAIIIEIAILTPPTTVNVLDEITIGEDGLVIEAEGRRGLLLPKVATRQGWDRSEFVRCVCLKAGLPPDTWPEHGRLQKFQTQVIQEQPGLLP